MSNQTQGDRVDRPAIPELGAIFESVPAELPCCERWARVPVPPNINGKGREPAD